MRHPTYRLAHTTYFSILPLVMYISILPLQLCIFSILPLQLCILLFCPYSYVF